MDRNEDTVFVFHRWSRSWCPLRTHPGKESGTADRRITRPLGDGAWRAVRDLDSDEEARPFACRIRMPCRGTLRPSALQSTLTQDALRLKFHLCRTPCHDRRNRYDRRT